MLVSCHKVAKSSLLNPSSIRSSSWYFRSWFLTTCLPTHGGSSANGRFSFSMSHANDSNCRIWDVQNLIKWMRRMKRFLFRAGQNLDVENINWRSAWSGFVMEVFATLSHVFTPAGASSQTVASIFKLRLKSPMNLVRRNVFSVEKSNTHFARSPSARWNPKSPWWSAKTITIFRPSNSGRGADSTNKMNNGVNI
jgi:hypothetical protein